MPMGYYSKICRSCRHLVYIPMADRKLPDGTVITSSCSKGRKPNMRQAEPKEPCPFHAHCPFGEYMFRMTN